VHPAGARRCPVKRSSLVTDALEVIRHPGVAIEMSGDEGCRVLYGAFTKRHARWRLIQSHRWGVALLRVPDSYDGYLKGSERSHLRREVNRAVRAGYAFGPLDPIARLDEVMDVNRSAEERQGRPIHPAYLDRDKVRRYFERSTDVYGVTDGSGVLKAYLCLRTCGEVAVVERLLGHSDDLRGGIMWVLLTGAIRELIGQRQERGGPTWMMYDKFSGATVGMRQFKRWLGCEPYRVSWSWRG
jgi:hypothetical protein